MGMKFDYKDFGRVGILLGGPSTERNISFQSGKAVSSALRELGLEVVEIDIVSDNNKENISLIKSYKIDCAFIVLHGYYGEDGQIQELLEYLNIPYTGSNKFASRLAMDKVQSRRIFEIYGLAVPRYRVVDDFLFNQVSVKCYIKNLRYPLVVKPAKEGSSIGLSIVDNEKELFNAINLAFEFDDQVIIEEYIEGRELTVGILEDKPLPVIEIIPKKRFFDYEAKYTKGLTNYVIPAQLELTLFKKSQEVALLAHKLLGCNNFSRVDMILGKDNNVYVLEVNTIPGLTSTSLLPKAAKARGIDFPELCLKLLKSAYAKKEIKSKKLSLSF